MKNQEAAKKAWMLWHLLEDLEALLWEIYHEPFSKFLHRETQEEYEETQAIHPEPRSSKTRVGSLCSSPWFAQIQGMPGGSMLVKD
jgi:hypothetical protein